MEKLPKFKTAQEEAEFWETHSPLDFADQFEEVKEPIVDRRGRKKGIYIRVDPEAIELARSIGAELGIGYQTLFRMWIMEGLSRHLTPTAGESALATGHSSLGEILVLSRVEDRLLSSLLRRLQESKVGKVEAQHGRRPS